MSYLWMFQSFSKPRLDELFPNGDPDVEAAVIDDVSWDDWAEMDEIVPVVKHIIASGITYDGLSEEEAEILDQMIPMFFIPEARFIEPRLELEAESPNGVRPAAIDELIEWADGKVSLSMLPILLAGRRYGTNDMSSGCEYCILSEDEVNRMHAEMKQIMDMGPQLQIMEYYELTDCLLDVLAEVGRKSKALFGSLS